MAEAKLAAKKFGSGKWKSHSSPGNSKTNAVFVCNEHVDCTKLLRVLRVEGPSFVLQDCGAHTVELNTKKRSNSALTYEQEDDCIKQLRCGGPPGWYGCVNDTDHG